MRRNNAGTKETAPGGLVVWWQATDGPSVVGMSPVWALALLVVFMYIRDVYGRVLFRVNMTKNF